MNKIDLSGKILLLSTNEFTAETARKIAQDTKAYCLLLSNLDDIRTLEPKDMDILVKWIDDYRLNNNTGPDRDSGGTETK